MVAQSLFVAAWENPPQYPATKVTVDSILGCGICSTLLEALGGRKAADALRSQPDLLPWLMTELAMHPEMTVEQGAKAVGTSRAAVYREAKRNPAIKRMLTERKAKGKLPPGKRRKMGGKWISLGTREEETGEDESET